MWSMSRLMSHCSVRCCCSTFQSKLPESAWTKRDSYKWFLPVQTRWKDNDMYGHVTTSEYDSLVAAPLSRYNARYMGIEYDQNSTGIRHFVVNSAASSRPPSFLICT
jgi:hypothetical protein